MNHAIAILKQQLDKLINSPGDITHKEKLQREIAGGLENEIHDIQSALIFLEANRPVSKPLPPGWVG